MVRLGGCISTWTSRTVLMGSSTASRRFLSKRRKWSGRAWVVWDARGSRFPPEARSNGESLRRLQDCSARTLVSSRTVRLNQERVRADARVSPERQAHNPERTGDEARRRRMTHAPERTQAPNLLRASGLAVACWGLTVGVSVMLGVLVTFHELVSPFTVPDVVALLGQVVAGLALFLSRSWGYRLGWIVSMYLCVLGTFLMVAPPPEYSEPNLILGSAMFGWVYLAPGALLLLGLVAPASKRWHDDRSGSPKQPVQ